MRVSISFFAVWNFIKTFLLSLVCAVWEDFLHPENQSRPSSLIEYSPLCCCTRSCLKYMLTLYIAVVPQSARDRSPCPEATCLLRAALVAPSVSQRATHVLNPSSAAWWIVHRHRLLSVERQTLGCQRLVARANKGDFYKGYVNLLCGLLHYATQKH